MTRDLPSEGAVRAAMTTLLDRAAAGTARATVTALAVQVGISRPALYRHYPHLIDELVAVVAARAAVDRQARPPKCEHEQQIGRLKLHNDDLRRHVQLYEEVIRQLTVDNTRLRQQLNEHADISDLARRHGGPSLPP